MAQIYRQQTFALLPLARSLAPFLLAAATGQIINLLAAAIYQLVTRVCDNCYTTAPEDYSRPLCVGGRRVLALTPTFSVAAIYYFAVSALAF